MQELWIQRERRLRGDRALSMLRPRPRQEITSRMGESDNALVCQWAEVWPEQTAECLIVLQRVPPAKSMPTKNRKREQNHPEKFRQTAHFRNGFRRVILGRRVRTLT